MPADSTANPGHFHQNWAGLAVLFSRQIINGSRIFLYKLHIPQNTFACSFSRLISDGIGSVYSKNSKSSESDPHLKYFATSVAILFSSYVCTAAYLKFHFKEAWGTALLYPYYHGRNLFHHFKRSALAIWKNEELPEEPEREQQYAHFVKFFECVTEAVLQLCLSSLILREFGLSNAGFQAFNQLSGIFSSLVSIVLLFAKVGTISTYYILDINVSSVVEF